MNHGSPRKAGLGTVGIHEAFSTYHVRLSMVLANNIRMAPDEKERAEAHDRAAEEHRKLDDQQRQTEDADTAVQEAEEG